MNSGAKKLQEAYPLLIGISGTWDIVKCTG
jgi:hypothetical protein